MLLALCLADFADDDGRRIFPSVDTLGRKTRQSRRSVQTQLRRMEIIGYISAVGKSSKGTTEYRINLDFFDGGAKIAPPSKGRKSRLMGAQNTTKRGAKSAPKPPEPPFIQPPHNRGGVDLIYPPIRDAEREVIAQMLAGCPVDIHQQLLDELAGAIRHQKIRSIVLYARALVRAAAEGRFTPGFGVGIAAARQIPATVANLPIAPFVADPAAQAAGERLLQKIIREKASA